MHKLHTISIAREHSTVFVIQRNIYEIESKLYKLELNLYLIKCPTFWSIFCVYLYCYNIVVMFHGIALQLEYSNGQICMLYSDVCIYNIFRNLYAYAPVEVQNVAGYSSLVECTTICVILKTGLYIFNRLWFISFFSQFTPGVNSSRKADHTE